MPQALNDTDRARLLARAQKLKDAQLDDFGEEAREHWNGRQAGLFKYSGDDQQLRKQLIDAGFAEVIQRGARSRPGILDMAQRRRSAVCAARTRACRRACASGP